MLTKILKSRTVWTIIVTFIVNGIPSVKDQIPAMWLPIVDAILGLAAIYFRVKPQQNFQ